MAGSIGRCAFEADLRGHVLWAIDWRRGHFARAVPLIGQNLRLQQCLGVGLANFFVYRKVIGC